MWFICMHIPNDIYHILYLIISLYVKGININQTEIHLKTFSVSGGISNNVANFPTIKLPDQNNAASTRNR